MIHFALTRRYADTIAKFLLAGGRPLASRIRVHPWEEVFRARRLPLGTWILGDFERLSAPRLRHAIQVADALEGHGEGVRLLNHPRRALGRYGLLRRLHDEGINPYSAHRVTALPEDLRYPVFLRLANDHQGARTPLLHRRDEIDREVWRQRKRRKSSRDMLVVEFCDTVDARGRYRKYGAFCVGGRIIARHLFFGSRWSVKRPDRYDESEYEQALAFVTANPHEKELERVFALAGLDYGRVDYALRDGRPCIWEINDNPMISIPQDETEGLGGRINRLFHERFLAALEAIDSPTGAASPVELPPLRLRVSERLDAARGWCARKLHIPAR